MLVNMVLDHSDFLPEFHMLKIHKFEFNFNIFFIFGDFARFNSEHFYDFLNLVIVISKFVENEFLIIDVPGDRHRLPLQLKLKVTMCIDLAAFELNKFLLMRDIKKGKYLLDRFLRIE